MKEEDKLDYLVKYRWITGVRAAPGSRLLASCYTSVHFSACHSKQTISMSLRSSSLYDYMLTLNIFIFIRKLFLWEEILAQAEH